ncbi:hypothetical protein AB9K41_18110, partial [Cribrihabitans sp. XS_ASV171]
RSGLTALFHESPRPRSMEGSVASNFLCERIFIQNSCIMDFGRRFLLLWPGMALQSSGQTSKDGQGDAHD